MKRVESLHQPSEIIILFLFLQTWCISDLSMPYIFLLMFEIKKTMKETSSFSFAHWFFGRSLGLVALTAFLSYWVQADALIGPNGSPHGNMTLNELNPFLRIQ